MLSYNSCKARTIYVKFNNNKIKYKICNYNNKWINKSIKYTLEIFLKIVIIHT